MKDTFITHQSFKSDSIIHGFITKNTGSSCQYINRPYELVAKNREIALNTIYTENTVNEENKKNTKFSFLNQIHSNIALNITDQQEIGYEHKADAQITNIPKLALAIMTADCVPILLKCEKTSIICAIHAGWKGARYGVIENSLDKMIQLGAKNIEALIGPCIHQKSYEVSEDFYYSFIDENTNNKNFFIPSTHNHKHYMFDLPLYVTNKLKVYTSCIYNVNRDSFEEKDNFFSYRRCTLTEEKYDGNSILSIIMIQDI